MLISHSTISFYRQRPIQVLPYGDTMRVWAFPIALDDTLRFGYKVRSFSPTTCILRVRIP